MILFHSTAKIYPLIHSLGTKYGVGYFAQLYTISGSILCSARLTRYVVLTIKNSWNLWFVNYANTTLPTSFEYIMIHFLDPFLLE